MKNLFSILLVVSLFFAVESRIPAAEAREMSMTYLGALVGAGSPSDADAGLTFGGTFGRRMTPDFGVGAYFSRMKKDATIAGIGTASNTFSAYGVEGNYYFSGDMDGLVFGMKLGMVTRDVSVAGVSGSTTPVSWGPKLAFDYKFTDGMSLGFEGNILFQASHTGQGAYSLVNMLGALKLWF